MRLVYTFSKKLNHTWLERTIELYHQSYDINSKFHPVTLYTDNESLEYFEGVFDDIKLIDTSDVIFFDDLKFKVLNLLNVDDVICDGDLFLNRRLWLNNNYNILCDTLVETKHTKHYDFYEYYRNTSSLLIKHGINNIIPFYNNKINKVINIGLLWFKNINLRNDFLNLYNQQKEWILKSGLNEKYDFTNDFKNTVTFSQYLLSIYASELNLKIGSFKSYCDYNHYSGGEKYHPDFMKRFQKELI